MWSGIYKPLEIENKENKMNVEALERDKVSLVFISMDIRYLLWGISSLIVSTEIYCLLYF